MSGKLYLGTASIDASAALQADSTTLGSLPAPRMTTAQRDAISTPAESLLIFNTDNNEYEYYDDDNSVWVAINAGNVNRLEVINNTVSTIATEKAVYISGHDGTADLPEITLADANAGGGAEKAIGITQASVASGATGFITTFGVVTYPTTGMSVGDDLFVSETAGELTTTEPATSVYFGEVLKIGASGTGLVFATPQPQGTSATDGDAIHDNVAGEINAVSEKVSPVSADVIIIEDSADSYNKKKAQLGNLPSSGGIGGSTGATDNAVIRADGTGGSTVQSTGVTIDDNDRIVIPDNATVGRLNITPRSTAPSAPNTEDIYLDDGTNRADSLIGYRQWNGASWDDLVDTSGISGSGDVSGPASSTDNAIARFDGAGGKTIQNSGVTIDDSNNVDVPGALTLGTELAVAEGGTGSGTASGARTNLGVAIGSDVQAYDADLAALAALAVNGMIARTGAGTVSARTVTGTTDEVDVSNGDGVSGNPTIGLSDNPIIPGTGAMILPSGTTAQRPTPSAGQIRFNTSLGTPECYDGSSWDDLAAAGGGGSTPTYYNGTYTPSANITTASATYVVIDGTNITESVVLSGGETVMMRLYIPGIELTGTANGDVRLVADNGSATAGDTALETRWDVANTEQGLWITETWTGLAADTWSFEPQWKVSANAFRILADYPIVWEVLVYS